MDDHDHSAVGDGYHDDDDNVYMKILDVFSNDITNTLLLLMFGFNPNCMMFTMLIMMMIMYEQTNKQTNISFHF